MMIELPNYQAISRNFAQELLDATQGRSASIPFITHSLPKRSLVASHQIIQAFVIGGTNGSSAVALTNENGKQTILEQRYFRPLPHFATKEDFLEFVLENLDSQTQAIGINLAYALIPLVGENGALDGLLNQGDTKGSAFRGLQKEQVGKTVTDYIREVSGRNIVTTVANDTVCLLLSGLEDNVSRHTLIGTIVGTGYNVAFFLDDTTVVNLQASDFTGFKQTESGKIIDQNSNNPGEQLYNKEVAAGELYKHFNALIPLLHLGHSPLNTSEELSLLAKSGEDAETQVAKELFERSAGLVAAHLAGIYDFKGRPKKITSIIEGSLMDDSEYKRILLKHIISLGVPEAAIQFKKIKNSDVLGALKLITG